MAYRLKHKDGSILVLRFCCLFFIIFMLILVLAICTLYTCSQSLSESNSNILAITHTQILQTEINSEKFHNNQDVHDEIQCSLSIDCKLVKTPELCHDMLITQSFNLTILSLNIRSIQCNFDDFLVSLKRFNIEFDVIILSECWLSDGSIIPQITGYHSYHTTNYINQNSGVTAYVRNHHDIAVTEPFCEECNCLEIILNREIMILGVYRSPFFRDTDSFHTFIDRNLQASKSRCVVLVGDVNLDICRDPLSTQCADYLCLLSGHQMLPAITVPTRLNACLDHIFVRGAAVVGGFVCQASITDHNICVLGMSSDRGETQRISKCTKVKTNFESIISELLDVDWSNVTNCVTVNGAVSRFNSILKKVINKNKQEIKVGRSKNLLKPWVTTGIVRCQKTRDKLHIVAKNNPTDPNSVLIYKRYRNFLNELQSRLKTEYQRKQLLDSKGNPKKLWKNIKDICSMPKNRTDAVELTKIVSDPITSLNICNQYFSKVGLTLANDILASRGSSESCLASEFKSSNLITQSFFLHPTDNHEVRKLILELKNDSAPGLDGCTPILVKKMVEAVISPFTYICNLSLSSGIFPDEWKLASVTPVHKGGNRGLPSNFRPISLLSIFSKLLEKLVNKRLINYLDKYELLSPNQFGFRRGKSTEDAVLLLTNTVSSALDNGQSCMGVFLDLAKAFDTVSTQILMRKLEYLGIRGVGLDWFHSYLTGRRQCIRVGSTISDPLPVDFGVPQGSILGPTLFTIYMNDILDLPIPGQILCYADDTVVVFKSSTWDGVRSAAEQGLSLVSGWLCSNLLTLNISKTKYLSFYKTEASSPASTLPITLHTCGAVRPLSCSCNQIGHVESIKYLGVFLDKNLSFKNHISSLAKRIRKSIFIMKALRQSATTDILLMVYKTLTQSLLHYCILAWGGAIKTKMLELERAQRSVLKVMLRKPFRFSSDTLYNECKVLRVRQIYILKAASAVHKRTINSAEYELLLKRRIFELPLPVIKTSFAKRLPLFQHPHVYNRICRKVPGAKNMTTRQFKLKIEKWLLDLDYQQTEDLI